MENKTKHAKGEKKKKKVMQAEAFSLACIGAGAVSALRSHALLRLDNAAAPQFAPPFDFVDS